MQIRINLLPSEYRKKEMTPLATLLPGLVCLTIVLGAGAFWAFVHFGELAKAEATNRQAEDSWSTMQGPLKYLADLKAEESDYQARQKTIWSIAGSRVPWTRKLDQFCDLVANDDGGERYLVWAQKLEVKKTEAKGRGRNAAKVGESVALEGLCFSADHPLNRFNNFHEALKQNDFFQEDFLSIDNPAGQAVGMDDEMTPARAWTIKLGMLMRAREAPKRVSQRFQAERGNADRKSGKK